MLVLRKSRVLSRKDLTRSEFLEGMVAPFDSVAGDARFSGGMGVAPTFQTYRTRSMIEYRKVSQRPLCPGGISRTKELTEIENQNHWVATQTLE